MMDEDMKKLETWTLLVGVRDETASAENVVDVPQKNSS